MSKRRGRKDPPNKRVRNRQEITLPCFRPQRRTLAVHASGGLIANTTTEQGLRIRAGLDTRPYPTGVAVTPAALKEVRLTPDSFHGDWNYLITPHR